MIIACPSCERNFEVPDAAFLDQDGRPRGRKVRCAACTHTWVHQPVSVSGQTPTPFIEEQAPPLEEEKPAEKPKRQVPPPKPAEPPKSKGWFLFLVVFLLSAPSLLILMRQQVVTFWPQAAPLYASIGLGLHPRTSLFQFEETRWGVLDKGGVHVLHVQGKVVYPKNRPDGTAIPLESAKVPLLRASVYGPAKCEPQGIVSKMMKGERPYTDQGLCLVDQWTFQPADTMAFPGEEIPFQADKVFDPKVINPKHVIMDFERS